MKPPASGPSDSPCFTEQSNFADRSGFEGLGVRPLFIRCLMERGITAPTEIQRRVIPRLLGGGNLLFSSPTGTGKTFAYLIPLLQFLFAPDAAGADVAGADAGWPRLLICAPTYELCSQIKGEADFLIQACNVNHGANCDAESGVNHGANRSAESGANRGVEPDAPNPIRSALIIGGGSISRQIDGLRKDKPDVIIGNPGRLLQLARMGKLKLRRLRTLVLDEGDRLMAEELAAETRELTALTNPLRRTVACSATLSIKNQERLRPLMGEPLGIERAEGDLLRENIEHWALWSEGRRKIRALRSLLGALKPRKVLIFTSRAGEVGNIVSELQYHHSGAQGLHGNMEKQARKQALEDFRRGRVAILVTSDLAARGLDIPDISHIIALDVPPEGDPYIHRAGRTARAGKRGVMVTIGDEEELERLSKLEKKLGIIIYPKVLYQGRLMAAGSCQD